MNGNEVFLSPGDMVIYRGCDLLHWRNKFDAKEDSWQVQGFFHYVDANGPHKEHYLDKRENFALGFETRRTQIDSISNQKSYILNV
jgi:hypothetical protein